MKRNDVVDLRTKTIDELKRIALDLREEIMRAKTEKLLGKVKNTNITKNKKKDVARVLTILHMKSKIVVEVPVVEKTEGKKERKESESV